MLSWLTEIVGGCIGTGTGKGLESNRQSNINGYLDYTTTTYAGRRTPSIRQVFTHQSNKYSSVPPVGLDTTIDDLDILAAFPLSSQDRLHHQFGADNESYINDCKEQGNRLYADKLLFQAIVEYSKGLACFVNPQTTLESSKRISKKWSLNAKASLSDLRNIVTRKKSSVSLNDCARKPSGSNVGEINPDERVESGSESTAPAARSLPDIDNASPEDIARRINLMTILLSNRSAALSTTNSFEDALLDAMTVIKWRPDWVKGYFRKAEALSGLQLFTEALEAYYAASALDPESKTINQKILKMQVQVGDLANGLVIHQLFPGREICKKSMMNPIQSLVFDFATKMRNFIYLIVNADTKECLVVDICWDVDGVMSYAKSKGLTIVGAIVTHYHIDHVGGIPPPPYDSYGVLVDGLAKLLKKLPHVKAYAHELDIDAIIKGNPELSRSRFHPTTDGTALLLPLSANTSPSLLVRTSQNSLATTIGTHLTEIKFMHTPGHTPGSQCILVNRNRLLSGDTLFIGSCGRVDSPDSCKMDMYNSLQVCLAALSDDVAVFPGHDYGGEITSIGIERTRGFLRPVDKQTFTKQF
ncbi:hypothetical protein QVD99_007214 [Batrachochytrium dendrobatidis]|nr:hypothetical protein O5D80_007510 [Batrachochytrium dendrobatidis]KAK5666458.1 hypothetical protein QVD99_007214 [Batrachochytrium dendrobatidis]